LLGHRPGVEGRKRVGAISATECGSRTHDLILVVLSWKFFVSCREHRFNMLRLAQ
jgi:hypothetical protein